MRLRAELKFLHSPQLQDIERSQPTDPTDFEILVQALIGVEGQPAADTFDFIVCTPNRLAKRIASKGPISGHTYLFMARYDYAEVRKAVAGFCEKAVGQSWLEIVTFLSRYGRWEYEEDQQI